MIIVSIVVGWMIFATLLTYLPNPENKPRTGDYGEEHDEGNISFPFLGDIWDWLINRVPFLGEMSNAVSFISEYVATAHPIFQALFYGLGMITILIIIGLIEG